MLGAFQPAAARTYQMDRPSGAARATAYQLQAPQAWPKARGSGTQGATMAARSDTAPDIPAPPPSLAPLGAARAQLHENYIIAQTESGIVIVDQHAAHERLVYEKLKRLRAKNGVPSQALLIPEIVELSATEAATLLEIAPATGRAWAGWWKHLAARRSYCAKPLPFWARSMAAPLIRDILNELGGSGGFDRAGGTD